MKSRLYLTIFSNATLFLLLSTLTTSCKQAPTPAIRIHYLGHASFVLQFDNGITVLTDYGTSNAYGLNSPIYDLGGFKPDVVTYSHEHADHYGGKVPDDVPHTLTEQDGLTLDGLVIEPIRTCEASLYAEDNTSYLFTYKGFTILHLGDAQAYITNTDREDVRKRIKETYPGEYDLLLMPIGWTRDIIPEAESFIDLLQPHRVIPMHYWSPESKADFLLYLETQNEAAGKAYHVQEIQGADYSISISGDSAAPIQVISLDPAPFPEPAE